MTGRMIDFDAEGTPTPGYLAMPDTGTGPGVVVLHEWWGLTAPVHQACDRLAEAGFVALAPDLYRGKTTASVQEAEALGAALDRDEERWRGDIKGALPHLRQHGATSPADGRGAFGFVAFSLGGSYALDMSINLAEEIAAVVTFYATYPGLDYRGAKASYLCHFAEDDTFVPAEEAAQMERDLQSAGRPVTVYIYPGAKHWFFDADRPDAYDAAATSLAWERTIAFLNAQLHRA
ncbi:MAG TPA: dienelactone hydrolase family protein [Ktedonobacterales bacterium]